MLQQETLNSRNGRWTTDYRGQWWDEFNLNDVETTYVIIEILSMYGGGPHFKEVEFYIGKSMSCMLILLISLSSTEYEIVSIFKQIYCFPSHTNITKHHQAQSSIPTIIIISSSSSSTVVVVIIIVIVVVAIYIINNNVIIIVVVVIVIINEIIIIIFIFCWWSPASSSPSSSK